jgi:hypothetical protein
MMNHTPLAERLEAQISPEPMSGCWLWTGTLNDGYGVVRVNRKSKKAHRVVFERARGPISAGLTLDHLCRVRSCVNPDHLEPVTNRVNCLRGESFAAKAARRTHCRHGHPLTWTRRGRRWCRPCDRVYSANYRQRQREAKARANAGGGQQAA